MLEEKKGFKSLELQDELNFKDSRAIRKTLKPLLKERVIFKKGKGSGTKYYLNKNIISSTGEYKEDQTATF